MSPYMAVQAQYPSNILLLNRGVQEEKNLLSNIYSLQSQPGGNGNGDDGGEGSFLDQSHMLLNNGVGNNPRKRGRDLMNTTTAATTTPVMNQLMLMQYQPSLQLIDLSQLHTVQSNVVSTGLRLAFGEEQQSQHQQQFFSSQSSVSHVSFLSEDFTSQLKQQRDEIEQFVLAQGEQLRRTLAEKRQRHYKALLVAEEDSVAKKLREKDVEVERAARRKAELEARAAQLSTEGQAWQSRAREQEVEAATLRVELQRAMLGGCCSVKQNKEDGGGVGCSAAGEAEDAESAYIDPDRVVVSTGRSCKVCQKRVASVVLLPCRHLCLCSECDAVAEACPLCLAFRRSSLEALLS